MPERRGDGPPAWSMLVPWVDVAILAAATVFFSLATARSPGQVAELPLEPFADGVRTPHVFVLRPSPHRRGQAPRGIASAFFRDERFSLGPDRDSLAALRRAAAEALAQAPEAGSTALVYADGEVSHRDTMRFCTVMREAGFSRVCFAVRPEAEPEARH